LLREQTVEQLCRTNVRLARDLVLERAR
jgi:hypothetical protein